MKKISIAIVLVCIFVIWGSGYFIDQTTKPIGGSYNETAMKSLIGSPQKIPFFLRLMIWIADKKAQKEMLTGRILSWSPKIGIGSGLLELLIEDGAADCLEERMIKILRIKVSFAIPSAFALDINSWNYKHFNITEEEIKGLQGIKKIDSITSFSEKEKVALKYAHLLSKTPVVLNQKLLDDLRRLFTQREIVTIAALIAKVNYWARLVEALRIKPAGYTDDPILHLEKYDTFTGT
jgi:hypothetical protein